MRQNNKLTWREFVKHARHPFGYGGYEKVFLFHETEEASVRGEWFYMCYKCLEDNDESGIREYAEQIYNGELEVFLVNSADIEVDEIFCCEECNRYLSPYQDDEDDSGSYEDDFNCQDFLPAWAFRMEE